MATPLEMLEVTYNASVRFTNGELEETIESLPPSELEQPAIKVIIGGLVINVSQHVAHEYHSIRPLKGKYADDPSWETFPDFLEEYNRKINELYNESD